MCGERHEGTPQGGPLSPLLANLLLDDLDKELERRGHRFCRYADDCNIYVRSQAAGERVMASVTSFLEGKLRLKVNQKKSAVAPVGERQFLGHRLGKGGRLGIGRKSIARAKDRLREITGRRRPIPLERMIEDVNSFTAGWVTYYRHAQCQSTLRDLDGWLRRKFRCVRLTQCKRMGDCRRFSEEERRPGGAGEATGFIWEGMVAVVIDGTGQNRDVERLVRSPWTGRDDETSCRVEHCRKPPWYVTRTPGGVRGGCREAPPYSMHVLA